MLFEALLGVLLVASVAALGLSLLALWRRVKVLGRSVGEVGSTMARAQAEIDAAKALGPLGAPPCPTCGAPASAATKRPSTAPSGVR